MTLDELKNNANVSSQTQDENIIIDPNVLPIQQKESSGRKIVTPEEMGFKKAKVDEGVDDEDKALSALDNIIEKRIQEVQEFNETLDATGELTEQEWREMQDLKPETEQDRKDIENLIGTDKETGSVAKTIASKIPDEDDTLNIPTENLNPLDSFNNSSGLDELEEEFYNSVDEEDEGVDNPAEHPYSEEVVYTPQQQLPEIKKDKIVPMKIPEPQLKADMSAVVFPDDEYDEDDEEEIKTDAKAENEKRQNQLRSAIKDKIKPVTQIFDISSFTIEKKPISVSRTLDNANAPKVHVADWALMSTEIPISMKGFTGVELDKLSTLNQSMTTFNAQMTRWKSIYDHNMDPNKAETLEKWLKCTSFLDIEHIWMSSYRSCFEGANYLQYDCKKKDCKHLWLSDNTPVMDMVKFDNDKAKEKFISILNKESNESHKLYKSEIVPISNTYAFGFREPSIWNVLFEPNLMDREFVTKYDDLVALIVYIDNIYYIDQENQKLVPIAVKEFPNNMAKTLRGKIVQYSKIIRTLTSDQYTSLISYMNEINDINSGIKYVYPEATCPKCGTKIEEQEVSAEWLVFTRHQLAGIGIS